MNKLIRIALLILSLYMYYSIIISTGDPVVASGTIVLIAVMLIAMELVRRKGNQIFEKNSCKEAIVEMSPEKFKMYIGDLYRRKGYKIDIVENRSDKGYDILAIKGISILQISCIAVEDRLVVEDDFEGIQLNPKSSKINKKNLIISNADYTDAAKELAEKNEFNLIDIHELMKIVGSIIEKKEAIKKLNKVQRA